MKIKKRTIWIIFGVLLFFICGIIIYYIFSSIPNFIKYTSLINPNSINNQVLGDLSADKAGKEVKKDLQKIIEEPIIIPVTHIKTPDVVKAIYISNWVAGSNKLFNSLVKLIDETELNSVIIDIKDSTGRIGFTILNEEIQKLGVIEKRISNIRQLTNMLHEKNIYVIGRISVFQDPYLTKIRPEWAINKKSDGSVWKDRKGLAFLDPAKEEVHKYILSVALGSYGEGFDEINFDYIRYPSDGNMKDIDYRLAEGQTRADNIENFFKFISTEIKKENNIPISADLFGLTTEAVGDMGIGQVWERALPYFDFLAPMVYPSHYATGYSGYENPGKYPYEVIYKAISGAINKTKAVEENINKIRPWLQDFDLGAIYTKEMVQAQMKAIYDLGLSSWMLWDPGNKYTPTALKLENS